MESIGDKLRGTREGKSLSVDQVARDTNIAKRYILALEGEDFSEFPGEPYLIGFLRNYSDYLGLDAEEIVSLYKNFKIQEQPVPMEELLEPKRPSRAPVIVGGVVVLAAIVVAAVLFVPSLLASKGAAPSSSQPQQVQATGTVFHLSNEIVERRFASGDTVVVPVGKRSYNVKLTVSGSDLVLHYANGTQSLAVGQEKSIDLTGNGTPDIKVFLRTINTQNHTQGVVVRFDRFIRSPKPAPGSQAKPAAAPAKTKSRAPAKTTAAASHTSSPQKHAAASAPAATTASTGAATARSAATAPTPSRSASNAPAPSASSTQPASASPASPSTQGASSASTASASQAPSAGETASAAPAPSTQSPATGTSPQAASPTQPPPAAIVPTITPVAASAASGPTVVLRNAAASPFSVNVQFTGGCLFRYKVDGKSESQHYFQKGQQTQIQAKRQVEIWASNGGALNVTISGNSVDMGSPGEIIARKIGWVSRATGSGYLLEMTHLK